MGRDATVLAWLFPRRAPSHSRGCGRCSLSPWPLRAGGRFGRLGRLRWLGWLRQVRLDQLLDRLGQLDLLQPRRGDILPLGYHAIVEVEAAGAALLLPNLEP